jgi:hypothetical protein
MRILENIFAAEHAKFAGEVTSKNLFSRKARKGRQERQKLSLDFDAKDLQLFFAYFASFARDRL